MNSIVLWTFSTFTLLGDILLVIGIPVFLFSLSSKKKSPVSKLATKITDNALTLALIIATIATLGSLTFSEILHFTPCKLCWFQRIAMYPQVVILGVAVALDDAKARISALILSTIGLLIAIYHILLQYFPNVFPCSDEVASCAYVQFKYFGYITIPLMAATAFALILLLMLFALRKK